MSSVFGALLRVRGQDTLWRCMDVVGSGGIE